MQPPVSRIHIGMCRSSLSRRSISSLGLVSWSDRGAETAFHHFGCLPLFAMLLHNMSQLGLVARFTEDGTGLLLAGADTKEHGPLCLDMVKTPLLVRQSFHLQ